MNITCSTKDLAAALSATARIVNSHTTMSVLANILITTNDEQVAFRATDLETTLEVRIPGEVREPGSALVPAKAVSSYAGNLPTGIAKVSTHGMTTRIESELSQCDFYGLNADEFPPLPDAKTSKLLGVATSTVMTGVDAVTFCASREPSRGPVLMGTLLEIRNGKLRMVATDGYRLALWSTPVDSGAANRSVIVPTHALTEMRRNLGVAETIELTILGTSDVQLRAQAGQTILVTRLVDGGYPNFQQVIPSAYDATVTIGTAPLVGALHRLGVVATDPANTVRIDIQQDRLVLTASSDAVGSAREEVFCETSGKPRKMALNARYFGEMLSRIESQHITISFGTHLSPVKITPTLPRENEERVYVLMPVRDHA
jgi:DNA polymerase-3 subunit beta